MNKTISFVLPVYNEEAGIRPFHSTLTQVLATVENKYNFQFFYINDGSRDHSLDILIDIAKHDTRVTIINFARNFGHQSAITAGINHLTNIDAAIIMDTDLQDPPQVCLELIEKWEEGYHVVYAQRKARKDGFLKKVTAKFFYRLLRHMAEVEIPADTGDFRLIDGQIVTILQKLPEKNRFLRGLIPYLGFSQTPVLFDRDERHSGKTGYSLRKMIKLAVNGITGFSDYPIRFMLNLGMLFVLIGTLAALLAWGLELIWLLWIASLLIIISVQLIVTAIIGLYITRIYTEVQNRPIYFVQELIHFE